MLKAFNIGVGNESPTAKEKKTARVQGRTRNRQLSPWFYLIVLPQLARGQQGCHCCLSGGHRARDVLAN